MWLNPLILVEASIAFLIPPSARRERLAAWFTREYGALLRFAYVLTGDATEAEDLVQETFVRVHQRLGFIDDAGLPAYTRQTLVNIKRGALRRWTRERRALMRMGAPPAGGDPATASGDQDVRRAFLALPVRQRACLALRFYEDMKEQDIADLLGMGLSAVKKNVGRGLQRMRLTLGEE